MQCVFNHLVLCRTHTCWNRCRESRYLQGENKKPLRYSSFSFLLNLCSLLQSGVPAFTAPQPNEAMRVLNEKASKLEVRLHKTTKSLDRCGDDIMLLISTCLQVNLQVVEPLDTSQRLGLQGEHQYLNAGLAVALCSTFLREIGIEDKNGLNKTVSWETMKNILELYEILLILSH